ncbi:Stk1 family PASTA domain-containing Ser/Thr kinase [Ancrocorticia populi]|uniref:non-specific serine/threonine protein kinase n=1 Tax=Ancrocorticia populi TaxID=2175228 RepID=A0A2V1K2T6_9ACTO|nr:Stk1 family PASTA domain-containing Ser/Thr kinase [Ancrocorticia populi]MDN6487178.1 Stk1 family PASTA domain-containing Ser/Thr kinase [Ancrocorticia sp.]PWF24538.1 Stk1 family PASTA domain-containing Ser/Thr kinase [Ancrocorticia populi]
MKETLIGSVVDGRYLITERLAGGGMAVVYRARDKRLERDVAMKLMHPHLAEQPNFTERFNKEARAAARLSSPYAVSVFDQGVWGSQAYLIMELIPGPDVRSELTRLGSFSLRTALRITEDTLCALAAAHNAGLIHRDVKPENVMLAAPLAAPTVLEESEISAKVTDFGLARAVNAASAASSTAMGTVAYIAPEVITEGASDARSDLYSVGIMLYELLTGELPYQAETPIRTAYMHVNDPMPRVGEIAEWMPPAVDSFIATLTAKNPEDRPMDGSEALASLRALLPTVPPEAGIRRIPVIGKVPPSHQNATLIDTPELTTKTAPMNTARLNTEPAEQPSAPSRTKRRWIVPIIVLLIALTGAAAWYFLDGPGQRVTVPDVTGQTTAEAHDLLEAEGLTVNESEQYSDTVPTDHVISSNPSAGSRIHPDSDVSIAISLGIEQVKVPDATGKDLQAAEALLGESRLEMATEEAYSETVEEGVVISQDIDPDSTVDHSTTLTLTVSLGREPFEVPNVTEQSKDDAIAAIEDANLTAAVEEQYSDSVSEGVVISQSPEDGTLFKGDEVSITVSKGPEPIEVPDVTFESKDSAIETLEDAGFEVKVDELYGGILGVVRFQNPEGGSLTSPGTEITISVM